MTKDDEEDDNLEAALDVVAKRVKNNQRHTYNQHENLERISGRLFTRHPPTAT